MHAKIERHVDLFLGQLVITTANFATLTLTVTCGGEMRQAAADRQRLEMEARMRQSKIRRLGGNDGDAGPLFDSQGSLF